MKLFLTLCSIIVASTLAVSCMSQEARSDKHSFVSSFAQCVAAGGSVTQNEPLQCAFKNQTFIDKALLVTILKTKAEMDGNSLVVQDTTGKKYHAVISIPNLGPQSTFDFNNIKVGNKLALKGEVWDLAGTAQITASFARLVASPITTPQKNMNQYPISITANHRTTLPHGAYAELTLYDNLMADADSTFSMTKVNIQQIPFDTKLSISPIPKHILEAAIGVSVYDLNGSLLFTNDTATTLNLKSTTQVNVIKVN